MNSHSLVDIRIVTTSSTLAILFHGKTDEDALIPEVWKRALLRRD
jgi:hypothetical protein